ncbi:MAG: DNA repair exonuclease [Candidatus Aenigmarchaeota archaeon]|nr:DNA repair exonuclease [Candidatus Aenigmarchaeota archaeon]
MSFRFAHIADVHLDCFREPELKNLSTTAFIQAIDACIEKKVDFVLIAGDLFNTSMPDVSILQESVKQLKRLKNANIPVYLIAGSHDMSNSSKTFLDVLEEADLFVNVAKGESIGDKLQLKFTVDPKTGAKITGLLGKKGGLDIEYYRALDRESLEAETGYKIFMFHSGLEEYKPEFLKHVSFLPISLLPKNMNYYAGGHIHTVFVRDEPSFGKIVFPGPTYPCNFKELEDLGQGSFFIVAVDDLGNTLTEKQDITPAKVVSKKFKADGKSASMLEDEIKNWAKQAVVSACVVLLRVAGTLLEGKPTDVSFFDAYEILRQKGALLVKRNTAKLLSRDFEEIKVDVSGNLKEVEARIIKEHIGKAPESIKDEEGLVLTLIDTLDTEKNEGETNTTFDVRMKSAAVNVFGLKGIIDEN